MAWTVYQEDFLIQEFIGCKHKEMNQLFVQQGADVVHGRSMIGLRSVNVSRTEFGTRL